MKRVLSVASLIIIGPFCGLACGATITQNLNSDIHNEPHMRELLSYNLFDPLLGTLTAVTGRFNQSVSVTGIPEAPFGGPHISDFSLSILAFVQFTFLNSPGSTDGYVQTYFSKTITGEFPGSATVGASIVVSDSALESVISENLEPLLELA